MTNAAISGDIIAFTSLEDEEKFAINDHVNTLLEELQKKYRINGFFGRLIQGDYIECALNTPQPALRIALLFKTLIKSISLKTGVRRSRPFQYFKEHGMRVAVAIAPMKHLGEFNGVLDGEAIYMSGRTIDRLSTANKKKIVIKKTMYFRSPEEAIQMQFDTIFSLLDTIIARNSGKQCEVVYYKLLGLSEKEIATKLNKNQSAISQHSTAAGWSSIEKTVNYFEKYFES